MIILYILLFIVVQSRLVKLVIPGNKTSAFIKDLEENQKYVFNVSARNSVGLGPGQTGSIVTGPQEGMCAKKDVNNTIKNTCSEMFNISSYL